MTPFLRVSGPAAIAALLLFNAAPAFADEAPAAPAKPSESDAPGAPEGEKKEEEEPRWEIIGDVVGGATTPEVLNAGRPTRLESPPANVFDSTRVTAYSF